MTRVYEVQTQTGTRTISADEVSEFEGGLNLYRDSRLVAMFAKGSWAYVIECEFEAVAVG